MKIAVLLHLLGVVVWVGGMFFAYMALRPAATQLLDPPQRLRLWDGTFRRFFPWVWVSVLLILASGLYLVSLMGGFAVAPFHVHAMSGFGILMIAIFLFVFFVSFRRLRQAVASEDWKLAGGALGQIRTLVGVNLLLGLATIGVATIGAQLAGS